MFVGSSPLTAAPLSPDSREAKSLADLVERDTEMGDGVQSCHNVRSVFVIDGQSNIEFPKTAIDDPPSNQSENPCASRKSKHRVNSFAFCYSRELGQQIGRCCMIQDLRSVLFRTLRRLNALHVERPRNLRILAVESLKRPSQKKYRQGKRDAAEA